MTKREVKERRFPCECGKSFNTAKEFSDHVHKDCSEGVVLWYSEGETK